MISGFCSVKKIEETNVKRGALIKEIAEFLVSVLPKNNTSTITYQK